MVSKDRSNKVLQNDDYHPPAAYLVSKGCERCPDYHKRDTRERINNRVNPNYGDCYRPICANGGILIKGDASKRDNDYKEQGECRQPPCKDYERRQRDGVCRPDECSYGKYNLKIDEGRGGRLR